MSETKDPFLHNFNCDLSAYNLPSAFPFPYDYRPDKLSKQAASELQHYIEHQKDWKHNFGLSEGLEGRMLGKMFGILVVRTKLNEIGYLCAFSGKLAGTNEHKMFVPPVYDTLAEGGFLNKWMIELKIVNEKIETLSEQAEQNAAAIAELKAYRKKNSNATQEKIFNHYSFLNASGEEKSLRELFQHTTKNPPSGAGECAAPKLLHYAFSKQMQPISLAEFWWGSSTSLEQRKHKEFYPVCTEKCKPILKHMLEGMNVDEAPSRNLREG